MGRETALADPVSEAAEISIDDGRVARERSLDRLPESLAPYTRSLPAKRAIEPILALLALLFLLPVLASIALVVSLDSRGSPIYRQTRVGREGQLFSMLKFRTMRRDAQQTLSDVLASNPTRREEHARYRKIFDDPRTTRAGRWLRRYSLDELPQLVNVVKGDMLLIGPRPYMPDELVDRPEDRQIILYAMPGLTGLWQVSGRNQLTFEQRLALDVEYVTRYSPVMDARIFLATFRAALGGDGAY